MLSLPFTFMLIKYGLIAGSIYASRYFHNIQLNELTKQLQALEMRVVSHNNDHYNNIHYVESMTKEVGERLNEVIDTTLNDVLYRLDEHDETQTNYFHKLNALNKMMQLKWYEINVSTRVLREEFTNNYNDITKTIYQNNEEISHHLEQLYFQQQDLRDEYLELNKYVVIGTSGTHKPNSVKRLFNMPIVIERNVTTEQLLLYANEDVTSEWVKIQFDIYSLKYLKNVKELDLSKIYNYFACSIYMLSKSNEIDNNLLRFVANNVESLDIILTDTNFKKVVQNIQNIRPDIVLSWNGQLF